MLAKHCSPQTMTASQNNTKPTKYLFQMCLHEQHGSHTILCKLEVIDFIPQHA